MNAKDFENHCKNLEGEGQHTVAAELRAYVAQQIVAMVNMLELAIRKRKQVIELREALARVEAEAGRLAEAGLAAHVKATAAQAQLAEAVALLREVEPAEYFADDLDARVEAFLTRHAQAEQQEAPKRGKPDWNSHGYDQIFQTSDGNWFGARAGWDFKGHISDEWKSREVSLLRDDGAFLAYGEPNPDWENSLEQRPAKEAQGAQASEFQREDRYIVIKRKDLGAVPLEVRESLGVALFQLSKHLPKRECLVIESDWPEYEPTWAAIQARVEGGAALATQPADSIAVNRLRLSLVAWDAELAEQDYQLTADDLREKLREIHRDIDRLMPEQNQPAVRGAEHDQ